MTRLLYLTLSLFFLLPSGAQATQLLNMESSMGLLQAQLNISGDTLQQDETGKTILMGTDQLLCTLTVHSPEKSEVILPAFRGASFGDFTLVDQGEIKTERTKEGLIHTREWLIEPHNPGTYNLPALVVKLQKGSMALDFDLPSQELVVQPLVIAKASAQKLEEPSTENLAKPGKAIDKPAENLDDILPPQVAADSNTGTFILFATLTLVGLGLLFWLILYLKKKKPTPLSAREQALADIAACANLADVDKIERLALILRTYLDKRFHLHCLEQTFDEYSQTVSSCPDIPADTGAAFLAILKRCDLIKFSTLIPEPEEAASMIKQIKEGLAACPPVPDDDKTCGRL